MNDFYDNIEKKILTDAEINAAVSDVKDGNNSAILKLFGHLLPTINNLLKKKIAPIFGNNSCVIDDCKQEIMISIFNATQNFEINRNAKYTTYIYSVIEHRISKFLAEENSAFSGCSWIIQSYRQVLASEQRLEFKNDKKTITSGAVAEELGWKIEKVKMVKKNAERMPQFISMEHPLDEDGNMVEDLVPDSNVDILNEVIKKENIEELKSILFESLSRTERGIIIDSFGLNTSKFLSDKKLAKKYDLTTKKVAYMREAALEKMRITLENYGF